MREWLDKLEPRERAVLLTGAVVAIAIIFFAFVWRPLTEGASTLRTSIESNESLLAYLYRAEGLGAASDDRPVPAAQSLVVLIDQTAQASGLGGNVTRTRPDGATRINLSFENAAFDDLLAWLVSLQQNEGVFVEGASINDTRERGRVGGQLLLSRP